MSAKSHVPPAGRMYFSAIPSTCFFTSRANCWRARFFSPSSSTSRARRKFSSGNLLSIGTIRSWTKTTASTTTPSPSGCCVANEPGGSAWPSACSRNISPSVPRSFGGFRRSSSRVTSPASFSILCDASCRRPSFSPTSWSRWPDLPRCSTRLRWPVSSRFSTPATRSSIERRSSSKRRSTDWAASRAPAVAARTWSIRAAASRERARISTAAAAPRARIARASPMRTDWDATITG